MKQKNALKSNSIEFISPFLDFFESNISSLKHLFQKPATHPY